MKRRHLIAGAAAAAGLASGASLLSAPAIAEGQRELRLVTTWPRDFPGLGTGAQRFAGAVTSATDGRLTVKLHAAGDPIPAFEAFDAVARGDADMYHGFEYFWQQRSRAFAFFASVPFGMTAGEFAAWIHHGGGQELWDELSGRFGIKPLACGNTGGQMGGWYTREVFTVEDFQGLKMRMPGLGGAVMRKIGAEALPIPGGRIVEALRNGEIAATEWVGPWNDLALGLNEAARFYYFPGFHEPGTSIALGINRALWDGLQESERTVIASAAAGENAFSLSEFDAENAKALARIRSGLGVSMRRFTDSILTAVGNAAGEVVAEITDSGDPMARRVSDGFRDFRRKALAWSSVSEQAFRNARLLNFRY